MDAIEFPTKRKEKLDDRMTFTMSKVMKAALSEMSNSVDVQEMTRQFLERAIEQWQERNKVG